MQRVFLFAVLFAHSALAFVQSPLSSIRQRLGPMNVHSPRNLFIFERQRVSTLRSTSPMMMYDKPRAVSVGIFGTGVVGDELFRQLEKNKDYLANNKKLDVKIVAIVGLVDGKPGMLLSNKGFTFAEYQAALKTKGKARAVSVNAFAHHIRCSSINPLIFDCTLGTTLISQYERWLRDGVSLVSPNNKLGSGPLDQYKLVKTAVGSDTDWGYEATMGSCLPIIHVLRNDLLDTGDRVRKIEGIFSGPLSYIFNAYRPGMAFSSVIAAAKAQGIMERDPRVNLSGMDVARKLVILARECGLDLELSQVSVESLVPSKLQSWQPAPGENAGDAFVEQLKACDKDMAALIRSASKNNEVLRYVGELDVVNKKAKATLARFPRSHPLAGTAGAENVCAFTTDRYPSQPLILQGPSAGNSGKLTAAGMYADFLRIARRYM